MPSGIHPAPEFRCVHQGCPRLTDRAGDACLWARMADQDFIANEIPPLSGTPPAGGPRRGRPCVRGQCACADARADAGHRRTTGPFAASPGGQRTGRAQHPHPRRRTAGPQAKARHSEPADRRRQPLAGRPGRHDHADDRPHAGGAQPPSARRASRRRRPASPWPMSSTAWRDCRFASAPPKPGSPPSRYSAS